jgi:hypothetical protein
MSFWSSGISIADPQGGYLQPGMIATLPQQWHKNMPEWQNSNYEWASYFPLGTSARVKHRKYSNHEHIIFCA